MRKNTDKDPDETVIDAARYLVSKILRRGYTIENLLEISRAAISLAGGILAAARQVNGSAKPTACGAGCNYCCYLMVELSVPELLNITTFVNENFSPEDQKKLKARVKNADDNVHGMSSYERLLARQPCPFLRHGQCSVYAARPLVCRGYNSHNWAICAQDLKAPRSWRIISHDGAQKNIYSDVADGIVTGLHEEGLPSETLELIAASNIAFNNPNAGEQWLAGEAVFEPAAAPDD